MHIVIAPNAFKNSLTAEQAADAVLKGFLESNFRGTYECFPIGDGGDGTGELIVKKCQGEMERIRVQDPLGRTIESPLGFIDNRKTVVIEMADASGLRLLKPEELNPLRTSTYGTGEAIRYALDRGIEKVIIGMGGSATVDGGAGILQALGVRFRDADGVELPAVPESLIRLEDIDISGLDKRVQNCEIIILCDVDNQLLGKQGAAEMFGPQKGATAAGVIQLDHFLTILSETCYRLFGRNMAQLKYGGTAGGAAAGLYAILNARLVNGIDHYLELTGFETSLRKADIVLTGEGCIDEQTLKGKGPFGVASKAKLLGKLVIGLAGKVPLQTNAELQYYFDALLAIGNEPVDLPTALRTTEPNLIRTARSIGNMLAQCNNLKDE